jgi:hypothetical protein
MVMVMVECPIHCCICGMCTPRIAKCEAKVWRLCRARHKRHYAESPVMPSEPLDLARSPVISSAGGLAYSA